MKLNVLDGITSLVNKLTNQRNPHRTNTLTSTRVTNEELRAIYRMGIGSKIIRLKTGIALDDTLQFESDDDREFYENRLQQLVKDASKFMLGFGRGLIVIHEPGADLGTPLGKINDWSRVRFHVFSGDMVYVQTVNFNLNSPDYLRPTRYTVRGFSIHPSRVVDMSYYRPVELEAPEYQFGGISEFELIRNELVNDQIIQRAVPAILEKSSTRYYKLPGFNDALADHKESDIINFMSALESVRSIYGAGVVDKDTEIETHDQALTNLAESDLITLRRLAMVTGLPLSWLVGEAARGLNSTGEGERQVLMQTITNFQSDYLLSPINRFMALCGRGRVSFKENQGETPGDRIDYETKAINNALVLWQMGEDYGKYLKDKDIVQPDAFEAMFDVDDDNEPIEPPADGDQLTLEQIMAGSADGEA